MIAVVVDLAVVPIGDVERAVGPELDVDRTEPRVAGRDRQADVVSLERGPIGKHAAHHHVIQQRGDAEEQAAVGLWKRIGFVDDERMGEPRDPIVFHGREVAEGIGV